VTAQLELRPCAQCATLFMPRRGSQEFCSAKCRQAYHVDRGATGKVSGVRRLVRGVSVVVRLSGPAAEHALGFKLGARVRLVRSND